MASWGRQLIWVNSVGRRNEVGQRMGRIEDLIMCYEGLRRFSGLQLVFPLARAGQASATGLGPTKRIGDIGEIGVTFAGL